MSIAGQVKVNANNNPSLSVWSWIRFPALSIIPDNYVYDSAQLLMLYASGHKGGDGDGGEEPPPLPQRLTDTICVALAVLVVQVHSFCETFCS